MMGNEVCCGGLVGRLTVSYIFVASLLATNQIIDVASEDRVREELRNLMTDYWSDAKIGFLDCIKVER